MSGEHYGCDGHHKEVPPPSYEDITAEPSTSFRRTRSYQSEHSPENGSSPDVRSHPTRSRSDNSEQHQDDIILDQALRFAAHPPPSYVASHRSLRPVAVPQVASGIGKPFARGYSVELDDHGISMDEFVEFVDNLNIVSAGSPPLQIVDLAGGIIGMVPYHHMAFIGGAVRLAAGVGKAAVSKTRGSLFIKKANDEFFRPRGLKVGLVSSEALKAKIELPDNESLVLPLEHSDGLSVQERRMAALRERTAPLTFDVPQPNEQSNYLNRLCAAQQARIAAKQERETLKGRVKAAEKAQEGQAKVEKVGTKRDKAHSKLDKQQEREALKRDRALAKLLQHSEKEARRKPQHVEKIERERQKEERKIEKEYEKEMRNIEKELNKVAKEYGKETEKEMKDARKEDKEIKASNKILWICVESL